MNLNIKDSPLPIVLISEITSRYDEILLHWYKNQFTDKSLNQWKISGRDTISQSFAINSYLKPLLNLLLEYLKTSEPAYLYGYLDERLRYAPHRESPEIRAHFFKHILKKDIKSILDATSLQKEQENEVAKFFQNIHSPLTAGDSDNRLCLLALGDCLMNEVRVFLPNMCRNNDISLDMRCIYFSAKMNQGIDLTEISEFIKNNKVDIISMSFFTYEALPLYSMLLKECDSLSRKEIHARIDMIINMLVSMLDKLREQTEATFLIHNISGLPLGRYRKRLPFLPVFSSTKKYILQNINSRIEELSNSISNTIIINEHSIAKEHGYRDCANEIYPKQVVANGMLHTGKLGHFLSEKYLEVLSAFSSLHKCKALMLDFDNTLWDGVMADGDVIHYKERQSLLKNLKDMGILLVSVSKNSEENIRWDEMILKYDDFVLHKINWDLKVNSISTAARELNIGIDSMVFIDDNPVELDLVKQQLKDTIALNANDESTWLQLKMMPAFPGTKDTEESLKRTKMYRQSFERKNSLEQNNYDYPKMMASLNLKVSFRKALDSDLGRIYELVSRTNQFNTTTIRYSKEELKKMIRRNDKYIIFVATLEDKFGSLGIVLVVILEPAGNELIINSLIMSCRAMGFALENQILYLLSTNKHFSTQKIIGLYEETDRNTPCANLYKSCNYSKDTNGKWIYETGNNDQIKPVSWIKMVDTRYKPKK